MCAQLQRDIRNSPGFVGGADAKIGQDELAQVVEPKVSPSAVLLQSTHYF